MMEGNYVAWRLIKKKRGVFYLSAYSIVAALGLLLVSISVYRIIFNSESSSEDIAVMFVGIGLALFGLYPIYRQGPNSAITKGVLRFNSEIIEFNSDDGKIHLKIPIDENTQFYPLVNNAFSSDLVGAVVKFGIFLEGYKG